MINEHTPLNVAFLGGGINSAVGNVHQIALEMDRRFKLVSGCFSQSTTINLDSGKAYQIEPNRIYSSLSQLIENEQGKIDAIIILTPIPDHKEHIIQCCESKIPVICEKSLAVSSNECQEISNCIKKNNAFLSTIYNYSGYPMIRELKQMINQGALGVIHQLHIEMPQETYIKVDQKGETPKPQDWRIRKTLPNIISLDLGVHLHHLISFLTQESCIELSAIEQQYGNFQDIIDNIICIANFTNNITCNIWYSKCAIGNQNGLNVRVFGSKGSAQWVQENPEVLNYFSNSGESQNIHRANNNISIANQGRYQRFKPGHPSGFIEAFANHYYDIADSLLFYKTKQQLQKSDYVFSIDEAIKGIKVMEAISKSSREKKWIPLI
jgi:predicted dehydrogenase